MRTQDVVAPPCTTTSITKEESYQSVSTIASSPAIVYLIGDKLAVTEHTLGKYGISY